MALVIKGSLLTPGGAAVAGEALKLVWGGEGYPATTTPTGAFSFQVPQSGKATTSTELAVTVEKAPTKLAEAMRVADALAETAPTTEKAPTTETAPTTESAPTELATGKGETLDGKVLAMQTSAPADAALLWQDKPLALPRGLGAMTIDGGEEWDVGVLVHYPDGVQLVSPRTVLYALPAAPRDAISKPVLESSKALGDVLSDTGTQLDTATKNLASTSYSLTDVQVTLKGAATADGFAFLAEDGLTKIDAASLSEVTAGFVTVPGTIGGVRPSGTSGVPSVVGYTRSLANRKLAVAGLTPEFSAQTVADASKVGRVVAQDPQPGEALVRGSSVRVFLGKQAPAKQTSKKK